MCNIALMNENHYVYGSEAIIELLTIKTVMLEMGVSKRTVMSWLDKGMLKRIKIGGLVRIDRRDLESLKKGIK